MSIGMANVSCCSGEDDHESILDTAVGAVNGASVQNNHLVGNVAEGASTGMLSLQFAARSKGVRACCAGGVEAVLLES